jgi:hypothetical protein
VRRTAASLASNLNLLDHAPLVRVLILDRIFDRDDVLGIPSIDDIHERRHGGGLS